jgi:hypothetical protein
VVSEEVQAALSIMEKVSPCYGVPKLSLGIESLD